MSYATIIKTNSEFYLLCSGDGKSIAGWKSEKEGIDHFEGSWDECHKRDYTWSMSATIFWLNYQPSIIPLSQKDIPSLFTEEELKNLVVCDLSTVAGRIIGVKLTKESSTKMWETGSKPRILRESSYGQG